jgi:two-component system chemotaxis sensor kinase CheA
MASNNKIKVVSAARRCSAESAAALKSALLDAFDEADIVSLSLSDVEEAEICFLQILYAAAKSARARGKVFNITGRVAPAVSDSLRRAGFIDHDVRDGRELGEALPFMSCEGEKA